MDSDTEKKLIELTKKLASLDQEISAVRGRGDKENRSVREEFLSVRDDIVNIMVDTGPIDDMRDHLARDVLRKVRDGNHYLLDIEGNRLQELFKREPEAVRGS